jgi:hypothetical protein
LYCLESTNENNSKNTNNSIITPTNTISSTIMNYKEGIVVHKNTNNVTTTPPSSTQLNTPSTEQSTEYHDTSMNSHSSEMDDTFGMCCCVYIWFDICFDYR